MVYVMFNIKYQKQISHFMLYLKFSKAWDCILNYVFAKSRWAPRNTQHHVTHPLWNTHVQFDRRLQTPSPPGNIWNNVMSLTIAASNEQRVHQIQRRWQQNLKGSDGCRCGPSVCLYWPGVPAEAVIDVQADTQTALVLLHVLAPPVPRRQRHLAPVKIIPETNAGLSISFGLQLTHVQVNCVWGLDWWSPIHTAPDIAFSFRYSFKYSAESSNK